MSTKRIAQQVIGSLIISSVCSVSLAQTKTTTKPPVTKPKTATTKSTVKPKTPVVVPAPAMKNAIDSLSYAIGVNVASYFKTQGVDTMNYKLLNKAFADVLGGKTPLLDEMQANMTLQEKLQAFANKKINAVKEESAKFLAENKKRAGVTELPSGLQYEVVKTGTGTVHPHDTSRVKVHYTGKLINGKKFDSSVDRGQPLEIGVGQVIKGWTEALKLMKEGDKWIIYMPSSLGYGDRGAGGDIPGGAALIFEVEMLEILK